MTDSVPDVPHVIRVAIIDDHAIVRSGLVSFLKAAPDLQVVGEGRDGSEALQVCEASRPDVVLMDVDMPEVNGIEATRRISERYPNIKIIALVGFEDAHQVTAVINAGAAGYIDKNESIHEMTRAIRAVRNGQATTSSPRSHQRSQRNARQPHTNGSYQVELKDREREVLALMVDGLTNPQIAARLSLSLSTIKSYVSEVLSKLHAQNRAEAVSIAMKQRLLSDDNKHH